MTGDGIRVVIADDHPVVRDGLSALLASVPSVTVAGVAANCREAVHAAVTLRPDVLVMDVQMPELTGVAAAGGISRVAPEVAVLMLTMFDDDYSVLAAMRAGARGYVLKGAQQDEIVRAIKAVAAGEAIFGPGIARLVLGLASAPPAAQPPFQELTSREREVLDLIAAGARNAEIARRMSIAQDGRQPCLGDLHQAAGQRLGRGHHPGPGRRPGPPRPGLSVRELPPAAI